jgi:two-component system chemotaxis response regulator CheB
MADEAGRGPTGVVCVGASAGGVDALREFVGGLDASLPAAVAVVLHIAPTAGSALDRILARASGMPAAPARDGQPLEAGTVHVARPDRHLLLEDGRIRLSHGPRENGVRPALDPLFRSAAAAYGERAIGIVLSGTRRDGTSGLIAIKAAGGLAFVQDPRTAAYPEMPTRALEAVKADAVAAPRELAAEVTRIVRVSPPAVANRTDAQEGGANGIPSYSRPSLLEGSGG